MEVVEVKTWMKGSEEKEVKQKRDNWGQEEECERKKYADIAASMVGDGVGRVQA